jgi:uncharacterized repeat protein (TIGR01451 family)
MIMTYTTTSAKHIIQNNHTIIPLMAAHPTIGILRKFLTSLFCLSLLFGTPALMGQTTNETISTGSFIINMGVTPQTAIDADTRYGEQHDLASNYSVSAYMDNRHAENAISTQENPVSQQRNVLILFFLPGLFIVFRARNFSRSKSGEKEDSTWPHADGVLFPAYSYPKNTFHMNTLYKSALLSVGLLLFSAFSAYAQTVYTSVQNGNWSSASTWTCSGPGCAATPPNNPIPSTVTINIRHRVVFNLSNNIGNNGTINIEPITGTVAELFVPDGVSFENFSTGKMFITNAALVQYRFVGGGNSGQSQGGVWKNIGGTIRVINSYVEVAQDWVNESGGKRYMEGGCLYTGQNFSNSGSATRDTLINVTVSIGWHGSGNYQVSDATIRYMNTSVQLAGTSGSFQHSSGSSSGIIDFITFRNHVTNTTGPGAIEAGSGHSSPNLQLTNYWTNSSGNTPTPTNKFNNGSSTPPANWRQDLTNQYFPGSCSAPPVNLEITKTVNTPDCFNPGDTRVYTITVSNLSANYTATNVQVSEPLDPNLIYVSHTASHGTYDPNTGIWNIGTIPANTTNRVLTITTTTSGASDITNTATILPFGNLDPIQVNNTVTITICAEALPPCGVDLGGLTNYLFFFADGSTDANWQGATNGFVGDVAVDGIQADERTSGGVPYAGTIYTNDATLSAWANIVDQNDPAQVNPAQAFGQTNESTRISGLEADLLSAFAQINALTATPGYTSVSSSSLDGLNTQNSIPELFVINITSGLSVSSKINITGDANDIFILRWDTDGNPNNGYQGQVKFQSGGAIVPLGGLKPTNFINAAGDINASGGGSNPAPPYPQGPRFNDGTGTLIAGGSDFSGGGFFTGYWLTTGDPVNGETSSLSNAIFVGGWYSTTTKFSMTSGTSGVYVSPPLFCNITPGIIANDDTYGPVNGYVGDPNAGNVLTNDLLNGAPVIPSEVTITVVNDPMDGVTLDPLTGIVSVDPGTPAGTYMIDYNLCENLNPTNCDPATITVTVAPPAIVAEDDTYGPVNGYTGDPNVGNALLENDLLNGVQVSLSEITATVLTPATPINGGPVPALNPATGVVSVPAGTPAGTYTIDYQICENLNPTNCDPATITVTVAPPAIVAEDDTYGPVNGYVGDPNVGNALLENDLLNGVQVNLSEITATVLTPATPINGGPVPVLNTATGVVSVPAGTPAGAYTIDYQICEDLNPANCDPATITVTVAPPAIVANDDTYGPVNGYTGDPNAGNVLTNDLLNGAPVIPGEVTITVVNDPMDGVTLDPLTGIVSVDPGTPAGTYNIE